MDCEGPVQPWTELRLGSERIPIAGCPLRQVPEETYGWLSWWTLWRRGVLPLEGGALDQPAKYLDVMEHLDGVMAMAEAEDADRRGT